MAHVENQNLMEALAKCIAECNHCAMACLEEKEVAEMTRCIRLCLDCAEICKVTASFVARDSEHAHQLRDECEEICLNCAGECETHSHMEHCRLCALVCRECAAACVTIPAGKKGQH
jgi:hypothetical protein